jgi:hypothetical protein
MLTDEVWRQLDPYAGRLSRRTVRRVRWVVAALLFLTAVAELAWYAGVFQPRISWKAEPGWEFGWEPVYHSVEVHNDGLLPIRVLGAGRSGPGFRLERVDGALPSTVEAGGHLTLMLTYAVTDCAAVPTGPWPVPIQVERLWGVQTVYVSLPRERAFTETGSHGPELEWQHWLADAACRYPT